MSPKTGRPKSENPKSVDLKVRIDKETHEALVDYVTENNTTKAQAVRDGIKLLLKKTE